VRRYLIRKLITYVLAFFVGVSIDWGIPHLIPGDPIQGLLSRFSQLDPASYAALYKTFAQSFGLNVSLWQQYLNFWKGLLTGNMGISISDDPNTVTSLVFGAMPYTLALLVPTT
jgi:peptide/nickel transport system permease protein